MEDSDSVCEMTPIADWDNDMASDGSEDHLPIHDGRLSHCIAMRDNPGGRKCGGVNETANGGSGDKEHNVQHVVIVKFDDSYLRTCPGIIRFLQLICSLIALVCTTSSGGSELGGAGYLLLPLDWHLRAYVFVTVLGFLISFMVLLIQVTRLIEMFPINWDLFDVVMYSVLAFLYLFGASLVASAVDFYQTLGAHVSQWTVEQLIVAVVSGYLCLFLYGSTAYMGYRRYKGFEQFKRRRFSSNSSQMIARSGRPQSNSTVVA